MKAILPLIFIFGFCHAYGQQKPASNDYTRLKITENGHKDSVIDNKPRLYNASLPEPCLKCVIQAVKRTSQLSTFIHTADSAKMVYEVDWYPSTNTGTKPPKAGSGLSIHVYKDEQAGKRLLASYIYDNSAGQLDYIISMKSKKLQTENLDSLDRLKIRNACFWGVASKK